LYFAFLVIIHWVLGFPQGHLQGSRSLRRRCPHRDWLDAPDQMGDVQRELADSEWT
jgi:hypothetical protein